MSNIIFNGAATYQVKIQFNLDILTAEDVERIDEAFHTYEYNSIYTTKEITSRVISDAITGKLSCPIATDMIKSLLFDIAVKKGEIITAVPLVGNDYHPITININEEE